MIHYSLSLSIILSCLLLISGCAYDEDGKVSACIADRAVELVSPTWDPDTEQAIEFLSDPLAASTTACPIVPFDFDPDAAFHLAIAEVIRASLAIVDFTEYSEGVAQGGQIEPQEALLIQDTLLDASEALICTDSLLGGGIEETDVADVINTIHDDIDINSDGNLTAEEVEQYLCDQGISVQGVC